MNAPIKVERSAPIRCAMTDAQYHEIINVLVTIEGLLELIRQHASDDDAAMLVGLHLLEDKTTAAQALMAAAWDRTAGACAIPDNSAATFAAVTNAAVTTKPDDTTPPGDTLETFTTHRDGRFLAYELMRRVAKAGDVCRADKGCRPVGELQKNLALDYILTVSDNLDRGTDFAEGFAAIVTDVFENAAHGCTMAPDDYELIEKKGRFNPDEPGTMA